MVSHGLESRQQVIVSGHHHTDVVGALDCKSYEIDSQGYIDALFLRLPLRVSELSPYHCSAGKPPALALLLMSIERAYVNFRVRSP